MPTNVDYKYSEAEKSYLYAETDEEKLLALEEMISTMPKHKSAESLRKNIRTRYKKLKQKLEKKSKKSKGKKGIKKAEMQAVLIGLTNSGKSSLLKILTNASPRIASYGFTTQTPEIGILDYQGVKIQIIDLPPIGSESFDKSLLNTSDIHINIIEKIHEINSIKEQLKDLVGKKKQIIVFNKIDLYNEEIKRKIRETLKSKRYNFVMISCNTQEGIEELKEKIWESFDKIRIYTKEPGKKPDNNPVILNKEATLKDVAEKIFHGFSKKVKEARITGPSSKFPNQKTSLKHIVKDKDIVEFHTQ